MKNLVPFLRDLAFMLGSSLIEKPKLEVGPKISSILPTLVLLGEKGEVRKVKLE